MPILSFAEYRPDVSDYQGEHSRNISGVVPQGDGYGPFKSLAPFTSALPAACRGLFFAKKADGTVLVFGATSNRLFTLDNSTFTWTPVTKVTALTSISNASPAVFTLTSHGLSAGDAIQLTTSGALPTGLSTGTVYYVISAGLTSSTFRVSATVGGAAINTSGAGSGTHSFTGFYSALSSTAQWQFAQFNNLVIAVQQNALPQVFDLTSGTAFVNLSADSNMPQAAYCSVVNRFLVLSGIASPNVYRVQWSGLNSLTASTSWTSGVNQSDYQDLADGGIVRGVAGGEFGIIFQDASIRRMTYAPGSPVIFGIDRISKDDGLFAPYSLIPAGDRIFFLSPQGFKMILPGGYPTPIGKEKFDHTFFLDVDATNPQMIIGAADPSKTRVYWAYKSGAGATGQFDKLLVYDWMLERATTVPLSGEFLATLAKPGLTLENVDAALGSNLDTLTIGSLDDIGSAALPAIASVNASHKLGLFSGPNVEATMETGERGANGNRIYVRGFRPVSDASTVYGSVSVRDTAQAAATYTAETLVDATGVCTQRVDTRYSRGRVRIPAGTTWTFAAGVEPDIAATGKR